MALLDYELSWLAAIHTNVLIEECLRLLQPGFLYVMIDVHSNFKVGIASNPKRRLSALGIAHSENPPVLVAVLPFAEPREEELRVHADLWQYKLNGEWFDGSKPPVQETVRAICQRFSDGMAESCLTVRGQCLCLEVGYYQTILELEIHPDADDILQEELERCEQ